MNWPRIEGPAHGACGLRGSERLEALAAVSPAAVVIPTAPSFEKVRLTPRRSGADPNQRPERYSTG